MAENIKKDAVVEEATAPKKATKKTATKKQEVKEEVKAVEETVVEEKTVKTPRKYEPTEMIMCHSVFPGQYFFTGPKTKVVYPFYASGDETPIEYQDLQSAMMAKKKSIMSPCIVIDDEELLEDVRWKQVKSVYETMFPVKNIGKLIDKPFSEFKKEFETLPIGAKKKVMMEISTRVREGEFSEMNKIRLVDEACNSNIAVLLQR
jgi:hypothetical protein